MFNLFKSSNSNQVAVKEPKANLKGKSTIQIIEEIHESFFTEVDKLLADAKIAKSLDTDKQGLIDKCARLKSLGFTNTKEVKEAQTEIYRLYELKKENEIKKTLMEAIQYFSFKYPNYKFITEESVKKICQKYGLIYGEIRNYLGTVPDKNLAQMEQFKIDEIDELFFYEEMFWGFGGLRSMGRKYITRIEYDSYHQKRQEGHPDYRLSVTCAIAPLEIAAPIKDFNMEGMEIKDFKISKIEIHDPVVLKPVIFKKEKFYLIVTAWGIEASDANVINEKMN